MLVLTVALNVSENVGAPSADRTKRHTNRIATVFMISPVALEEFTCESALRQF